MFVQGAFSGQNCGQNELFLAMIWPRFAVQRSRLRKKWPLGAQLLNKTSSYPVTRFEMDFDKELMEMIANFMNTGDFDDVLKKWYRVENLLAACEEMGFKELLQKVLKTVAERTTIVTAFNDWRMLRSLDHPSQKKALDLILYHLRTMERSEDVKNLSYNEMKLIMASDGLNIFDEADGWRLIKAWIKVDQIQRLEHVKSLFALLRFRTTQEAAEVIAKDPMLRAQSAVAEASQSPPRDPRNFLLALNGWSIGGIAEIEVYSNYTRQFISTALLEDSDNPDSKIAYASAVVFDGKLYVIGGGFQEFSPKVRVFDPATLKWSPCPSLKFKRCYASAVVFNEKIYVMGGYDGSRRLDSVEIYDPKTKIWKMTARMTEKRSDAAAVVFNGFIYVFGGVSQTSLHTSVERYDPATNTWQFVASLPDPLSGLSAVVYEGNVILLGGNLNGIRQRTAYKFTRSHAFLNFPQLITARSNAGAACYNGKLYIAGGYSTSSSRVIDSVEVLENGAWKEHTKLSRPKSGLALVTLDNWPEPPSWMFKGSLSDP
ncbi:hypothetical protein L596_009250 [Steinernema carpocapsae]|uniref:BACK domain-containing protein n=1 Tax=Steinernema carpocapsae TaxID=34508 RepID=A0A4U5PES9_STECR|nr:hypothetical protein L596_009250 [Steinernema carpocapsae]